jgi:hypothetical protein
MERLDREEAKAQIGNVPAVTAPSVAEALADLKSLYTAAEPPTQHRILQALFEQVEVLGPNEVGLNPSVDAEARGWAEAMTGTTNEGGTLVRFVRRAEQEAFSRSAAS